MDHRSARNLGQSSGISQAFAAGFNSIVLFNILAFVIVRLAILLIGIANTSPNKLNTTIVAMLENWNLMLDSLSY
jgi:hypothetical protein